MNTERSSASASPGARARQAIRGLYAITTDERDTGLLLDAVDQTLRAGTRLLQYRNKTAPPALRREQLRALKPLCDHYACLLVVNDDWRLALELQVDAVHIGGEDGDAAEVRAAIGPNVLLGVSCYADLERAVEVAPCADYLAFGSVFRSRTKPAAASAPLGILGQARLLGKPIVAIGGITPANARQVLDAGAEALAVSNGIFGAPSISAATSAFISIAAMPR